MAAVTTPIESPLDRAIPADRRADVDGFLAVGLAGRRVDEAEIISGGASGAALWRLGVDGRSFVLRFDAAPDGFRDPARQYACQRIAAGAGVAPALVQANPIARLSLSAFVRDEAFGADRPRRLTQIATAVARLHAAPVFPALMPYLDAMDLVLAGFTASGVVETGWLAAPLAAYARLAAVYRPGADAPVASHNDLNPSNVLFEAGRAVIVDWESAFAADRYVDLAAILNFFAADAGEEDLILATYFGRPPTPPERVRALLMRQVNRLFYAAMLLGAAARERPGLQVATEEAARYRLAALAGQMSTLATTEGKVQFGCAFLNAARAAMAGEAFEAALSGL